MLGVSSRFWPLSAILALLLLWHVPVGGQVTVQPISSSTVTVSDVSLGSSSALIGRLDSSSAIVGSLGSSSQIIGMVQPVASTNTAQTTSTCYATSAASTLSTNCKGSAGNLYGVHVTNTTSVAYYLRMYNSAAAPTCSSATGFVESIPALATQANGRTLEVGQAYSTGIGFCLTGGGTSTDNTNSSTGVYITLLYK